MIDHIYGVFLGLFVYLLVGVHISSLVTLFVVPVVGVVSLFTPVWWGLAGWDFFWLEAFAVVLFVASRLIVTTAFED